MSFTNWCFVINICIIPYAFPALLTTYQNIIQNPFSMLTETYFDLKVPWNILQSSIKIFEQHLNNIRGSMEFHGTWATKPQVPWNSMEFCPDPKFHGIPWNFCHTPEFHRIPWNSMELLIFPQKSSMEFYGIPWNFFKFYGIPWNLINFTFKKIISINIVLGIWLMIRYYLAKISQKPYISISRKL